MILEKINQPNDVRQIPEEELSCLAEEIRQFLIQHVSVTGGHLASNLGVVELTIALHRSFCLPEDKIIWDVGHQAYTHKILTGRREQFDSLRQYGGLSGFPKRRESDCDSFDTGHSSTSISAGLGLCHARDLQGQRHYVVSVIGDGALTGGLALEALNNASSLKSNFIIVLNDNEMSIAPNVGGLSTYLSSIRTSRRYTNLKERVTAALTKIPVLGEHIVVRIRKTKEGIKQLVIPGMFFEEIGLTYLGPVDGHNIPQMMKVFADARNAQTPVVVHVRTTKGRGYEQAEQYPDFFHGVNAFHPETGLPVSKKMHASYTDIFSYMMEKFAVKYPNMVAITAAMPDGTGLKNFSRMYPERFFDVGIAEEHAVTFAAGLAVGGLRPVVAIYSSFLQRAFDEIVHDVCIQDLPVVFAVDRAGVVGSDGETHNGILDLSYLSCIPGLTLLAPKNKYEFMDMLEFAMDYPHPVAIRYPRGTASRQMKEYREPIRFGHGEVMVNGSTIALLAVGAMVEQAMKAWEILRDSHIQITVVNMRFISPIDSELLDRLCNTHSVLITLEDNVKSGGMGEKIAEYICEKGYTVRLINKALPDAYLPQGNVEELYREKGVDGGSIAEFVRRILSKEHA